MSDKAQEPPNKTRFRGISGLLIVPIIVVSILGCNNTLVEYEDSTYSKLEDERNEKLALKNIKSSLPEFRGTNINVNSFKGIVLISGQVVSEDYITLATKAVESMRNVSVVHNELLVAGPTSMISRANDTYLSSKIRAKLASSKNIEANRVKVVVENGEAYLMGRVTTQEAEILVNETKQVWGIQKIVKVFTYLN
tara:strand:- start:337 stop:921 length:585 start_codon:yes stop_codon:yes gene_type:complete